MPDITKYIMSLTLLAIAFTCGRVNASEDFESLEDIRNAATNFAASNISTSIENTTIEATHLDSRLRLKKCAQPLTTSRLNQNSNTSNMTVIVKCDSAKPWTVYVPVKTMSYVTVAVVSRPLAHGIPVTEADVTLEQREINRLTAGYFENIAAVIGRQPKRSLAKGSVISPRDLNIKKIISKGSRVSILAETNGISVRMPGLALTDAGEGDRIQVQNLSSERTITGTVMGPNIIKVSM